MPRRRSAACPAAVLSDSAPWAVVSRRPSAIERRIKLEFKVITREEVVERVTETARLAGLTFEEFMEDGLTDRLTDGDCRDDWLIYRDILLDQYRFGA